MFVDIILIAQHSFVLRVLFPVVPGAVRVEITSGDTVNGMAIRKNINIG
jgi:hypothetical protein